MIGPGSLLLTLGIVAVIFGTKRLRSMGEDLGAAVKSFRKGLNGETEAPSIEKSSDSASGEK